MRKIYFFSIIFLSLVNQTNSLSLALTPFTSDCVPPNKVPFSDLGRFLGNIFSLALIGGSILLFLYLLLGGIQWLTSGGDKTANQAARDRLTAALVGLLIILAIWGVFKILESAFGISVLSGIKIPADTLVTSPLRNIPTPNSGCN